MKKGLHEAKNRDPIREFAEFSENWCCFLSLTYGAAGCRFVFGECVALAML